jgi:predicted AAA+ superfamily ATPase
MKEIFKRIITDFIERDLKGIKPRDINIPLDSTKIVSLIGIRRSGKTYILYDLINQLRDTVSRENILYINFEDDRLFGVNLKDLDDLLNGYFELYPTKRDEKIYLFLDEIQEVDEWEKFIRRVYDTLNVQIFITGSSSKLLSKEIATSLRGRTISFEVFPLSFKEYLTFKDVKINLYSSKSVSFIQHHLNAYLVDGGFIEVVLEEDKSIKRKILQDYLDLIIYRDLIERYGVKNLTLLKFMIKYLFSNPATLFSFNKFYNELKSSGFKLSKDTLIEYYGYLEDAYTLFKVPIFRNSIKEELRNPIKSYIIDNGFYSLYDSSISPNYSKLFENLVFMHLRREYKDVHYYKIKQETDFYANGSLINVSYEIDSAKTLDREINSLLESMEYFQQNRAVLITNNHEELIDIEGKSIHIIPLYKWLL